eukprot:jgi/Botrbrau1/6785/Bobra.0057s0021.1
MPAPNAHGSLLTAAAFVFVFALVADSVVRGILGNEQVPVVTMGDELVSDGTTRHCNSSSIVGIQKLIAKDEDHALHLLKELVGVAPKIRGHGRMPGVAGGIAQ